MCVLLFTEFGKLRQALLILGIVPLAMLGGLLALYLRGQTLNVASAVGFIGLFGVAVQNGIIMVANLNRMRETGASLRDAIIAGAAERFRPVLMTATVATIGMLPAALATGVGSDVQRNVATVVIGGLSLATLLTLFILPTFYFVIERAAGLRSRSNSSRPSDTYTVPNWAGPSATSCRAPALATDISSAHALQIHPCRRSQWHCVRLLRHLRES